MSRAVAVLAALLCAAVLATAQTPQTFYLYHFYTEVDGGSNSNCNFTGTYDGHRIDTLSTGGCAVNPDPMANGTSYNLFNLAGSVYTLEVDCDVDCKNCLHSRNLTLDACTVGEVNADESFRLSSKSCPGGFAVTGFASNDVSAVHLSDDSCASHESQSFTNIGAGDGTCLNWDELYFSIVVAEDLKSYVRSWNCSQANCTECQTVTTETFGTCLNGTADGFTGSLQFVLSSTLAACPPANPSSSSSSLSTAAIAGIAVGGVVGLIILIFIGVKCAKKGSRRAGYESMDSDA
eukprot:m.288291 g.288291  ORF g.288291 m.288291 type:complete len:292 (+) comp55039_c0_seq4:412-1287(+)